jgi:hypothetical protein
MAFLLLLINHWGHFGDKFDWTSRTIKQIYETL